MTEIRNESDDVIQSPMLLYLCDDTNDENSEDNKINSIIDVTLEHDWLGDFYYFTNDTTVDTIRQKYAVFTEKTKYILVDINDITEKQKDDFIISCAENVVLSIYFHENGIQYWCIKNSNSFTRI